MKAAYPLSASDLREIEREYRIYLKQRRHVPGRRCDRRTFLLAAARKRLKKSLTSRAGITNAALMKHLERRFRGIRFAKAEYPNPVPDLLKAAKFARGPGAKSVLQWKAKEFTRWLGGPFSTAVSMVIKGLEGKPAPTRRELLRRFRAPGEKNCSVEELSQYRGMIDQAAAEITAPPKVLDLDALRKGDLFPRD